MTNNTGLSSKALNFPPVAIQTITLQCYFRSLPHFPTRSCVPTSPLFMREHARIVV